MDLDVRSKQELAEAYQLTNEIISRNYLDNLSNIVIEKCQVDEVAASGKLRLFKLNKIAYDKYEDIIGKLLNVYNAIYDANGGLALIINGTQEGVNFYLGVRSLNTSSVVLLQKTLQKSIQGNFPGCEMENLDRDEIKALLTDVTTSKLRNTPKVVSCVSGVATLKDDDKSAFVQGLEKFIDAMRGEKYTAIFLADAISKPALNQIRTGYEQLYSQLTPFAATQLSFGENEAHTITAGITEGFTKTASENLTQTQNYTKGTSQSDTVSTNNAHTTNKGSIASSGGAMAGAMIGSLFGPAGTLVGGAVGGTLGGIVGAHIGSETTSHGESRSSGTTESESYGSSQTRGVSSARSTQTSQTNGNTTGHTRTMQISMENKTTQELLKKIEAMLERVEEGENLGMWNSAAYFIAEDVQTASVASSTYAAIVRGEKTAVEGMHINLWDNDQSANLLQVTNSLRVLQHPVLNLNHSTRFMLPYVTPGTLVTTKELGVQMAWPRKSVKGVTVVEYAEFSRDITTYESYEEKSNKVDIGKIFHMGKVENTKVGLDLESLSMHTFIAGSTGSGKSNTVYYLLNELKKWHGIPFMVIEPAKGEYKHIFGHCKDVSILGTNPKYSRLLRINPFKFPESVHVLEHIDRLVEIFNVCWPMYAAMPAVLKEAILKAYEVCGWDLRESVNHYKEEIFPTFIDLQQELVRVITESAYSEEVKSNYMGALLTRIKSLTNGLNGQIFSAKEIDNELLFDQNVVVDLSRIGSMETKSLIMGILVMRLNEYRMHQAQDMNVPLKHITVLEEAHHLLKATSVGQSDEGSNMAGKSVEMLASAIAEMRTYGEGFIIADQSPHAVDISAIRNTNTKIILRLPEEMDRRLAGKSAALKEEQLDEIAKLPKGVAVVYQNNWINPVLAKINKYEGTQKQYSYEADSSNKDKNCTKAFKGMMLQFLLKNRVDERVDIEPMIHMESQGLMSILEQADIAMKNKLFFKSLINEYKRTGTLGLWQPERFKELSVTVTELLGAKMTTKYMVEQAKDFKQLTEGLSDYIVQESATESEEIKLATVQCLLKNQAEDNSAHKDIYSAWVISQRNKALS